MKRTITIPVFLALYLFADNVYADVAPLPSKYMETFSN